MTTKSEVISRLLKLRRSASDDPQLTALCDRDIERAYQNQVSAAAPGKRIDSHSPGIREIKFAALR
jgi:hypothetical protein